MKHISTLLIIMVVLLALGSAKVLLRTNPLLGIAIISGCALILAIYWFLFSYEKDNK